MSQFAFRYCLVLLAAIAWTPAAAEATDARPSTVGNVNSARFVGSSLKRFDEAVRANPKDKQSLRCRAFARLLLGDPGGALVDFTSALQIDAKDPVLFYGRGAAERVLGRNGDAIADFTVAIRLDPEYRYAYSARMVLEGDSGDRVSASRDSMRVLALILRETGQPPPAGGPGEEQPGYLFGNGPGVGVERLLLYRCWCVIYEEYRKRAPRTGERGSTADHNPQDAATLRNSALVHATERRLGESAASLDEAIRLAPNDGRLRRLSAAVRVANDDLNGALKEVSHAILVDPKDSDAYTLRTDIYVELGRYRDAVRDLDQLWNLARERTKR